MAAVHWSPLVSCRSSPAGPKLVGFVCRAGSLPCSLLEAARGAAGRHLQPSETVRAPLRDPDRLLRRSRDASWPVGRPGQGRAGQPAVTAATSRDAGDAHKGGGVGGQRGCWLRGWWCSTRAAQCVFQQQSGINRPCTPHPPEGGHPIRGPVGAAGAGWCWLLLRRDSCWRWLAGGTYRAWHGMGMGRPRPAARRHLAGHVTCMLRCAGVQGVVHGCREVHVVPLAPSMPMCLCTCT